jgi:hypothetical protein
LVLFFSLELQVATKLSGEKFEKKTTVIILQVFESFPEGIVVRQQPAET